MRMGPLEANLATGASTEVVRGPVAGSAFTSGRLSRRGALE